MKKKLPEMLKRWDEASGRYISVTVQQNRILELEDVIRRLEGEKAVWREWQARALSAESKFQSLAIDLSHLVRRYQDQP